uniref:Hypothetical secreted protein n=1 Tax=Glossina morsitans morsitans TaxID=37546 RepID=D3TSS6_GLOMM
MFPIYIDLIIILNICNHCPAKTVVNVSKIKTNSTITDERAKEEPVSFAVHTYTYLYIYICVYISLRYIQPEKEQNNFKKNREIKFFLIINIYFRNMRLSLPSMPIGSRFHVSIKLVDTIVVQKVCFIAKHSQRNSRGLFQLLYHRYGQYQIFIYEEFTACFAGPRL